MSSDADSSAFNVAFLAPCAPLRTPGQKPKRFVHKRHLPCHASLEPTRREILRALAALPLAALPFGSRPNAALAREPDRDRLFDTRSGSFVPASALPALLRRDVGSSFRRCIVAAEIHDNIRTHAAQLAVIDEARKLPDEMPLTVGFEQFYRGHTPFLAQFVEGRISLETLLQKVQWDRTWGFDIKLYAPIFQYCRLHSIPMVGLNVPIEFVRQVSYHGLGGLAEDLKPFLPGNMDLGNKAHYQNFMRMIGADSAHLGVVANSQSLQNYYQAQVLWEEYMSQSVAMSLESRPDSRMVALIGSGHVEGRVGFPDRIEKRCNERPYTMVPRPVAWTFDDGHAMPDIFGPERYTADLVWYTRRTIDLV